MPRRNNRKIPRKEGELGFDPSQYIGKGNTPFPDNYSSDIGTPGDFSPLGDSTVSPRDFNTSCDFRNIISQTEAMTTTASTPRQNVYARNDTNTKWNNTKRNDTRNKRRKKRPYQYRYNKARRPTKRIHRANAMIRKMRRGVDQVIEALKAEEALKVEEALKAVEAEAILKAEEAGETGSATTKSSLMNKLKKLVYKTRGHI